ncbi:placental protein 13-like [Papio anubis]|uniref:placental protein 13-like n=1 Tax=Papio anubis TaxID=9555 RepID=UPI00083F2CB1|nr:placental protein 13-like [Papio anubis]
MKPEGRADRDHSMLQLQGIHTEAWTQFRRTNPRKQKCHHYLHVCGAWKCEGRCCNVFFEDGKPFDLSILVLDSEYPVIINGQHHYIFAHPLPPCSVKTVQVWEDVFLISMSVCN